VIEQRQPVSRTGNGFVRGYPYPPSVFKNHHVSEIFSAKIRRFRAKYHETKELHGIFGWELLAFAGFTSLAGAMMDEFWVRRKVGCHKGV